MTAVSVLRNPEWGFHSGSGGSASNKSFRARFRTLDPSPSLRKMLYGLDKTPAGRDYGLDHASLSIADMWLPFIERYASEIGGWVLPHMSVNEQGEVTFEWWQGEKKLTVYFSELANEVVRVWGSDIESEMECLELGACTAFGQHWRWLQN